MIDTIIFDIGMVLVDFAWKEYLDSFHYSEETNKAVANAMFLSEAWNEFDKGVLPDEEILGCFINNNTKYEKQIREVFENIGDTIKPFEYSVDLIKELKGEGFHIYVLSNFSRKAFEQSRERMKFLDLVDGEVISYQVKQIKPERGIYETLIKKYGIIPERAVFLDDSAKNIKAAKEMGFQVIHFTDTEKGRKELELLVNL